MARQCFYFVIYFLFFSVREYKCQIYRDERTSDWDRNILWPDGRYGKIYYINTNTWQNPPQISELFIMDRGDYVRLIKWLYTIGIYHFTGRTTTNAFNCKFVGQSDNQFLSNLAKAATGGAYSCANRYDIVLVFPSNVGQDYNVDNYERWGAERYSLNYDKSDQVPLISKTAQPMTFADGTWQANFKLLASLGDIGQGVFFSYAFLHWGYTRSVCKNGEYTVAPVPHVNGIAFSLPQCASCKPGTWLTCIKQSSCTYHAIQNNEGNNYWLYRITETYGNEDVNLIDAEHNLVGSCHPCSRAELVLYHYGNYLNYVQSTLDGKRLRYYCPGGSQPPQRCPMYSSTDINGIECVCDAGYYKAVPQQYNRYKNPTFQCLECPPGNFCVNNVNKTCEAGSYSTGKASSCTLCSSGDCARGRLRQLCPAGSTQDDGVCVNCNECSNFGSKYQGAKPCVGLPKI